MSKKIANTIFKAMSDLAEVRHIYQRIDPKHELTAAQRKSALSRLGKVKKAVTLVEKEFKKKPKKAKKKR
ncbi:MAG: hypothetical protein CL943_02560 [Candidatus Diapherotrites archaeon]|uniref:Uncharacterized protein n=1 Tax=Candidatus Iainarchaeum sp. TaxID=3101447 RepID=A0A2D6M162_9ARCH|nr:hypothetical protein [Candidatus Diapherotrites archaeon]|tara:strand:- start:10787 stop:10996 length:210 start_codon:yes stop_codon:yes gene_type:complete